MALPPNGNGQPRKTRRVQPGEVPSPPPGPGPVPPAANPGRAGQPQVAPPSQEGLVNEFEQLVAANQARFEELARQGASPDPFYLVHARINHLIDAIAAATGPNGPRWAVMTRLGFERQIAAELEQAGPVTRRMQLAEGGRYTPGMIRDLARQTRTVRRTQ